MAKPPPPKMPQETKSPGTSVSTQSVGTAVSTGNSALPAFMQQHVGQGLENVGAADIETPRLKLLQGTSPEIEEFEEARTGMFWHTIAQMPLGRELPIVPLYIDQRAILWRPKESGGGILARADDNIHWNPPNATFDVKLKGGKMVKWSTRPTILESRLLEWGTSDPDDPNSQPAAVKMYNVVVALPTFPELPPAVITFQRTSIKPAKKFLGQLRMSRAPAFGCKFIMTSVKEEGPSGPFNNFKLTPAGFVDNEDDFRSYEDYYRTLKEMGLRLRDVDLEADPEAADVHEDADAPKY